MSRSQENSALLSTKAHSIDAKTGSTRQQFAHEVSTTNAIFRPSQVFPSLSTQENSSKAASYSSVEAGLGRNPEQFIPPLQAHYYPPTVPTAALSMALPYGMIAPPGMDPRSLNFYPYGSPVMSFQNYAASYGQGPRVKISEETTASDKTSTASTHVRSTESTSRSSKEPMRTESVIKTVTDKQDPVRKPSDPDKRNVTDSQGSNMHIKYPDNDTGSELGSSVDGKKVLPPRDSSLRDVQLREHSLRDAQHDKQPKVNDFDWTREKSSKSKSIEHLGAESSGIKRPTNGLSSWTSENGSFSSHDKSIISSEARSSPYPANEPPTLFPYHSSLPPRSSSSSTHSNVPSTMPKLTPIAIAPRISNASHLTSSYSADVEHRHSPSFAAKRQNYVYSTNPISSTPSVMGHSGVLPWTANGPGKPPQGDKTEDNWRTRQYPREDRDLNKTAGYESASKVHVARNFNPQPWERFPHCSPLASHLRAVGADKGFGKKDTEDTDFRDLSRDTSREGINSSEQSQVKTVAANKFGTVPVNLRKESDLAGTKITPSVRQEDYQRNQPLVGRNEKSVVGEYVSYNSKTEDAKGNLGNVIVQWKDGPFRVSVERREGGQKYPKPEMSKPSKTEHNRAFSNGYSNYDGRGQGLPYSELKSACNDKGKEDRARIVEPLRSREQALYQENSERKSDSRELSSVSDGRKNNDRNNNSTPLGAFPFYKHVPSGFPLGGSVEQKRFVDRAVVNDSEVSIPPNVTLDKYERREQEMEKNGLKRTEVNSFPRSVEGSHSFITKEDDSKRNEERRSLPRRDEAKPKALTGKFENGKRSVDAEEISSDENDDGHRRVTRETVSPDKRAQLRVAQSSDRRTASPAAGAVRQRRLSSPLSEQRSGTADKRHMTASNNVGMPFGASLQSRRIPSDGSEGHSRDSSTESRMEELGNSGPAQFLRMDGGAFPSPYFGQLLPAPQGLSEAPLLLLDPAFYGAMYRPHMMETPSQGIFPPGGFATDPMTGQIMMLPQLPPEAYIQMVAAENAFMNPMMDPRVAAMWGMPGALDDPQWQQFYQRMQQEQHKQLLEQSKQEFLMGKQGAPFPLASHPFFFGDKRLEQKRKEEMQDVTSTEQQPKSREIQQESSGSQPKETGTRPKVEPLAPQERTQHVTTSPRDSEIVEKKETTNQREEKPVIDSRRMKEVHQNLTEKQKAVQAKLVTQEQMAKQLEEYLSLDRLSQFQFPGPQANFRRERSSVNHTTPVTTASAGTLEADRNSVSPKTVSAAVTLSSLEKSRTQEINSAGRSSPHQSNETRIVSAQNSLVDRAKSPRLRPGTESTISNEIVEKPRRLEAQPNLVGERLVSRESREIAPEQVPSQFAHKLMAFGSIASEHLLKEKAKQESERERYEGPFWALNRGLALNFDEMLRGGTEKSLAGNFERHLLGKENSKRTESYGDLLTSLVKSEIERSEKDRQPVEIGLRESVESQVDPRGNLQTLASSEKLSPVEHLGGNSDYEDDFRTKCEIRRIASSFVPLEPDVENKENSTIFSLRPFKSDAERKQIRDNIDRLRLMAKRRNSKDRFMVFSRRRDVRSPTTILNSVTSAINDVAGLEAVEKEMRMKLAELQKRYREKLRELARLQPKYSIDDGNGKSTPIKRGPGRPRKRKYFGASCKGDKHSPVPTADENKEGDETPPASRTQTPEPNAAASESESLVSKDSEPPKKKKKKTKQSSNPVEQEGRATAIPILGMSPVELTDIQVHSAKKKKSRKPSGVEEESIITIPKTKPNPDGKKKKTAGGSKRRKGSPTEGTLDQQVNVRQLPVVPEVSATGLETDVTEAEVSSKNTKTKKLKPKKRARPKLTIDNLDGYEGKVDDESPLDSTAISCETPQASTSTKSKKAKGTKKKRKSTTNTPPKGTFEFPDMTSQDESFSENSSSVSPNEIAKEVVAMAAKQMEAQKKSMQMQCDNDDDVFTSGHDSRDGLSLLAQASFESVDKSSRRKKSLDNSVLSEDLLQKKRGRPKKETESPSAEPDPVVVPKKKKKKKVLDEDTTDVPKKKKKKKKKKITTQKEEITEEKPAEVPQEERPQLPSYQHQDKDETKQLETAVLNEDSEPEEDVFRPADEIIKDSGGGLPSASLSRENDDFKGSMSSLLSDEWQPRRSERIFINSSVTTNSSSSPLSPTTKGSEFSYAKKTKKGPSVKAKMARSDSQIEEEMAESDVVLPQKVKTKAKKKRGTGKSKKRISSDEDYEPIKVSRRVRSKSRQLVDFDDADEEEADDIQEDEEPGEEGETDVEINVTDKMDTTVTGEEGQERQQAEDVEGGRDIKPEVEEQKKEAEVKDEEEDSKMDVDETVEDRSDSKQIITADEVEESTVKESKEEATQEEEKTDEASYEQPLSPEDVRFTFLTEELREGAKLLLPVDSVFFPGRISTFNEPDLFGVILDGERGRRPHWKSTEQLRTQAVKDIQPPSTKFLPIGTRVCAHWSPQYRCFYPGTVTEAPQDEKEVEGKIWIEFDDGDSGFFQLDEIKRIHPDFPVEGADSTPILPEKRPRSSSFGNSQPTAIKDSSSRLRAEENTSEFSSGNESSGEIQAKRRRLRGNRKSRDDLWLLSKRVDSVSKDSNAKKREIHRNKAKEAEKHVVDSTGSLAKLKDKNYDSKESQENKVLDAPQKQKSSRNRGKVEVESKEATKIAESIKHNLPSNASAELKKSEKEIHSSDSSFKSGDYENSGKQSSDKVGAVVGNSAESSDQGEDSDANSDVETPKQEKGLRASTKGSSRTSEKDLRRRSLTLSLNSSFRSTRTEGESPTRDVLSASQDEDSESYSDAFDESPLVENKSFQPRLGRRRRSELDRLQVDMKFSGPLWQWSGKNFQNKRKGKGKKVFYKAIVRGDETISVGDCAVFMSNPTKNLNLPYVGRIESMWEGCGGNMVVKVKWFYHPEETKPGRKPSDGKQSLYRSTHVDENDVQTISHKCEVLTPEEFKQRLQSLDSPSTRTSLSDRVFCCIGSYDPNNETLQTEL